jgi:valyl-tRNA synthetase
MDKRWSPEKWEKDIYQLWEESQFFNPDKLPGLRKKRYSIVIPPPNITGSLHMGHALNNTIQDILIRYHRMKGEKTLWLPGTDHAGIATQNVIEKQLAQENTTRHQLGREKFIQRAWKWKEKSEKIILKQLKELGCSCDWSRQRFTLDKEYADAVLETFITYHQKGYLYRGPRIVNWCPRCTTAISDIEIKYQKKSGQLWFLKYPLKDNSKKYITVATTRPETMLGDTAVAVNPKDERYKDLIGKKVVLPLMQREIPIIAHYLVDPEFGTGAVKITPAHDKNDWQMGQENNLEIINVIGPDGKMTSRAGKYAGCSVLEARKKIIEELKEKNLLEKIEDYQHQISLCDRCDTPLEPQVSTQWFVSMDKLAQPAIKAVKKNKIIINPEKYKKIYLNWLKNIQDWCISRQLWWGHRLPVWFCQNKKEKYVVSREKPALCPFCQHCDMKQSTDVLDTWFSSALWPFATLGWPKNTKDLKKFYPTSLLSTAQDILYLWVARMVFSSLEFLNKIPFKQVYIHSTILSLKGKRMSKSLGTGIDPLDLISQYGADATRFGIIYQTNRDQQAIRFDERVILSARNFINKLWNICRFVEIQSQNQKIEIKNIKPQTLADKWILSQLNQTIKNTEEKINNYEFGESSKELYDFIWHDLADWYLEISKNQNEIPELKENTLKILKLNICLILRLLHPFIPFVTEKIYHQFNPEHKELLMIAPWPKIKKKLINPKATQEFTLIKDLVTEIRSWKKENQIPDKQIVDYPVPLNKKTPVLEKNKDLVENLSQVKLIL